VLEHVILRVRKATSIDEVVVAYPLKRESLPIQRTLSVYGVMGFAGSEDDVLDRYYQCARLFMPRNIVRITADCPLIDPELIDKVVALHIAENASYTSNRLTQPMWPDGEDVEVFTFEALHRAWAGTYYQHHREHVSPYMKIDINNKLAHYPAPVDMSGVKYSLDTEEDYHEIVRRYENGNYNS
jgi:spore coat polysaccharide biosynthesis protein SpsF (cytidylyltransferase family)